MKKLRTWLLAILCVVIPIQGFAGLATFEAVCPMMLAMADDSGESMAMSDCCNDAETYAKTGKACKSGQECPSGSQFSPTLAFGAAWIAPAVERVPHFASPIAAPLDKGVWRPPTQA